MEPLPGDGPSTSYDELPVVPAELGLEAEEGIRVNFSDSKRERLFYNKGVNSASKKNEHLISHIAAEVGCTEEQVKVSTEFLWLYSYTYWF